MMLIVGKGGEGKSRIGLVLKRLMGDAASNGSVQKVENTLCPCRSGTPPADDRR